MKSNRDHYLNSPKTVATSNSPVLQLCQPEISSILAQFALYFHDKANPKNIKPKITVKSFWENELKKASAMARSLYDASTYPDNSDCKVLHSIFDELDSATFEVEQLTALLEDIKHTKNILINKSPSQGNRIYTTMRLREQLNNLAYKVKLPTEMYRFVFDKPDPLETNENTAEIIKFLEERVELLQERYQSINSDSLLKIKKFITPKKAIHSDAKTNAVCAMNTLGFYSATKARQNNVCTASAGAKP